MPNLLPHTNHLSRDPVVAPQLDQHAVTAETCRNDESLERLRDQAGAIFDKNSTAPLHEQRIKEGREQVSQLHARLDGLRQDRARVDDHEVFPGQGKPWTPFDLVCVGLLAVLSVALLAASANTLAVALLSSGYPGFDSPLRSYFFSLTPIGLAVSLK